MKHLKFDNIVFNKIAVSLLNGNQLRYVPKLLILFSSV